MCKYVKVMFGLTSGAKDDFKYKLNEVTEAKIWNPKASSNKDFGGINFSTPDKILRWLHRGDTLYDITIPKDAEIVDIIESATPHGVLRANKVIISNPRKVDDNLALELYKISTIPLEAYPKALGAVSLMNYQKTALKIFEDKINKDNIDFYLSEWNDFIYGKEQKFPMNETIKLIEKKLKNFKSK